jgi:MinD-like ATPase involved in chromosome partitioning or flagellar assembly
MNDRTRSRFDRRPGAATRAGSLARLTLLDSGRWHTPLGPRPSARFFAVSGQQGVGKSTVAANLAIALAGLRSRVVLIDLDLRRPTQHRIFGVADPVPGLPALLEGEIDTMEQALTPTSVRNLFLVTADGTRPPQRPTRPEQQQRLLQQIWELDADIVIADIVADHDDDLFDLYALGAVRIVVATPDVRSIGSAYNFLRTQVIREIEHVAGGTTEAALIVAAVTCPHPPTMREALARLRDRPAVQAALTQALDAFGSWLIGNRARGPNEPDLLHAASRLFADYLSIAAPVLGVVTASDQLATTAAPGRPLLLGAGIDRNVRAFHSMAEHLLVEAGDSVAPRCVMRPAAGPAASPAPAKVTERPATRDGGDGAPLPAPLGVYMRRFPRHPVDWHARYVSSTGRAVDVRVFEISEGGASIEAIPSVELGAAGHLTFTQIDGQPTLAVSVMDAHRPLGRAGVRFDGDRDTAARLAEIARRRGDDSDNDNDNDALSANAV